MMIFPLLLAAAAPVVGFQSTAQLDQLVGQFTGQPIGAMGGARAPVDARLRLAPCGAPQLDWMSDRHDAVVVRCMAPAWRIFVPVQALPAPVQPAAAPAAAAAVRLAPVIKRGDPVTIEAGSPGFSVTRDGVALGDAPAGGRLLVKVEDSKPPVQTVAIEAGRVTLPGFGE